MKEKKGLEQDIKQGRLVAHVLPLRFGAFFFESVSLFELPDK